MTLAGAARLALGPLAGTWYRAIPPQHLATALHTAHTPTIPSRFSSGTLGNPQFEVLYLAEDPVVAMFEIRGLLGSYPGAYVANPLVFTTVVSVRVRLSAVVDITIDSELNKIEMSVQELTGDWAGYRQRRLIPPQRFNRPPAYSEVPTQKLGRRPFDREDLEGFVSFSARAPLRRNLIIFPSKLQPPSFVRCLDPGSGKVIDEIPNL